MKLIQSLLLATITAVAACAASSPANADAKAQARKAFEEARALGLDNPKAAEPLYEKAITLDPEYYEAYRYYIMASTGAAAAEKGTAEEKIAARKQRTKELAAQFEKLAEENPTRAVYHYALGGLYDYENPEKSYQHYLRAIQIDPKCGPAYDSLSSASEARGDLDMCREYARLSVESNPDEPGYWRHYVACFREYQIDRGIQIGREMAKKFPAEAASIMGYLAVRVRDEAKSREIYEMLRRDFREHSGNQLGGLWNLYIREDARKAEELAREMLALKSDDKGWQARLNYAEAVIKSDALSQQGKGAAAELVLAAVEIPRYGVDRRALELAKARAGVAGDKIAEAYEQLLAVHTKTPTDEYLEALVRIGARLGYKETKVRADVQAKLAANAKDGKSFELVDYSNGKKVSLDHYRGRVVLVNFWYPKCGPCRGEFPFLQAVLDKYKDRGFEILAINGHEAEDDWVMPLIKGWKLGFVPLKGTPEVIKSYAVRGYPSNFLYGPDGRIYFQPTVTSTLDLQRELELQIELLLPDAPKVARVSDPRREIRK